MTSNLRRIAISAAALVGLTSIVLPTFPVQAAPNDVVAVVVEGVGTSTVAGPAVDPTPRR